MKAYQKERLENAICYFASEHFKKTRKLPTQTYIYKYLSLFEFQILEETGEAPLGLKYRAMKRGPVPIEIYNNRRDINSECFCFEERDDNIFDVRALKMPNMDYFSEYEIQKMKNLIFTYATPYMTSHIMSESSHEKIRAWRIAYNERGENSIIDNSDTFEDLSKKDEKDLTPQEEHFLISESLKNVGV
ncbi:MAG: DUF4065 domain-containing protein [Candidatus Latescibacteria bacterium]|nr:DUF4065 domain-containing protein [Candidatus Latescibacterota bacterium]